MIRKEACRTMRSRSGRRKGDETDDDEEDEEEDDDDDSLLDEDAPDADEVMAEESALARERDKRSRKETVINVDDEDSEKEKEVAQSRFPRATPGTRSVQGVRKKGREPRSGSSRGMDSFFDSIAQVIK